MEELRERLAAQGQLAGLHCAILPSGPDPSEIQTPEVGLRHDARILQKHTSLAGQEILTFSLVCITPRPGERQFGLELAEAKTLQEGLLLPR